MKPWWEVLGIPRDSDRAAKRRAYAAKLKLTNPEDDPQGFMALRQAYEASLHWIDYGDEWEDEEETDWDAVEITAADAPDAAARQPFVVPVAAEPALGPDPDPHADARTADHAELRELTAALEAGLRGPWFKGDTELKFYLSRIIAAPALIELETRDAIEHWLADLLADTVPRSDPILMKAIETFRWDSEGERPPAVWRVLGRIDEWRMIQSLGEGRHELAAGWRSLTRKDEPVWQRRIGALRPGVAAQVGQLFDLADYQTPGIVHSFDAQAAAWWRGHLAQPRFGFVDLAMLAAALAGALFVAMFAADPMVRWGGAAVLLTAALFPVIRLRIVAPWRRRRDADYLPPDWISHGWLGPWAAALLLLIWTPAGPWMAGATVALSAVAGLWMAVTVGREPRIGNPLWRLVSFGALALLGAAAFLALSGAEQAALAAFAIASLIIAGAGANAIAELLWRVGEKPVLAASVAALLLLAAAAVRMALPAAPQPLVPWGAAAIAGMMLTVAVRELHDGSFIVRFTPLLRWALWVALVVSAILSTPPVEKSGAPPISVGSTDSIERIEPGFAALKTGNPALYAAAERIRREIAGEERQAAVKRTRTEGWAEIDRLVNAAYRQRLPLAPASLIAAEMDIRLATMREQQKRDPRSCASETAAASFTPSEALRKRHYRHALAVAGSTPEMPGRMGVGSRVPMDELIRAATNGDPQRAKALSDAFAGADAKAKCAAQIAMLEVLTARSDLDIAKTMRPGLIARAAEKSAKKRLDQAP
ncbi:hypothetical protein M9978_08565 [Sphingomonas sp. MG17]|uniref:J domain-containing protein n=1 Tax=Sphingomonas tagetis TaxID=2949092 RepID=A0A9X2KLK0_9SPHN|nr:hypothetical protein [Sphingomonas tagetis]MCP3730481.1 hypothetical protein [Sphingomonas tagetis]